MSSTSPSTPTASYRGVFGWVRRLKDWVEGLAHTRYGVAALFGLAVIESIFFPIPVDVLLIALCVSLPRRALFFATVCTAGSVVGALIGYGVGYWLWYDVSVDPPVFSGLAMFFFNHIPGFTEELFYAVKLKYEQYAVLTVLTAAFTPIPFKLITVTAGVFQLPLWQFFFASIFGRAARFFLVAALFFFFGRQIKAFIDKYLEILSVVFMVLLIGGFVVLKYVI